MHLLWLANLVDILNRAITGINIYIYFLVILLVCFYILSLYIFNILKLLIQYIFCFILRMMDIFLYFLFRTCPTVFRKVSLIFSLT